MSDDRVIPIDKHGKTVSSALKRFFENLEPEDITGCIIAVRVKNGSVLVRFSEMTLVECVGIVETAKHTLLNRHEVGE